MTNSITNHSFMIFDTETTSADPKEAKVIEFAILKMTYRPNGQSTIQVPQSWLFNPGIPIPPESSAVHHLTDEDVAKSPQFHDHLPDICKIAKEGTLVAHNIMYDLGVVPDLATPLSLCTLRLARHLWPKDTLNEWNQPLTSHQQQVLRYWLKLKVDTMGQMPHRAGADIIVTAHVLIKLLDYYLECGAEDSIDDLIEFAKAPISIQTLYFGAHAGKPLPTIPTEYLEWVERGLLQKEQKGQQFDQDLLISVSNELTHRRDQSIAANRGWIKSDHLDVFNSANKK